VAQRPPEDDPLRTAYLTLDEVHARQALRLGRRCGQEVHLVDLRSPDLGRAPFLVLDLDYVPRAQQPRLFDRLLPGLAGRLAAHSYNLSIAAARRLARAGVVVGRRLDVALLRRLTARPPRPRPAAPGQVRREDVS
jgi:hypothetical protein